MIEELKSNLTWDSFTSLKQYATFPAPNGVKLAFSIATLYICMAVK